jgi:hypothetical protein
VREGFHFTDGLSGPGAVVELTQEAAAGADRTTNQMKSFARQSMLGLPLAGIGHSGSSPCPFPARRERQPVVHFGAGVPVSIRAHPRAKGPRSLNLQDF